LKEALRGTPAEALIDPGAHEQGAGILATAFNATGSFRHLPGRPEWSWSALEWADTRHDWLFLSSTEESREAALPLQSLWLDCVARRLMAAEESRSQVWIIADELLVLRRQAGLETLVVRGRKRGLSAVLGFQAITQLRAIYGHDQTATLAVLPIIAFGAQRSATMIVVATATSVAVILLSGYVPSILAHYRFFVP